MFADDDFTDIGPAGTLNSSPNIRIEDDNGSYIQGTLAAVISGNANTSCGFMFKDFKTNLQGAPKFYADVVGGGKIEFVDREDGVSNSRLRVYPFSGVRVFEAPNSQGREIVPYVLSLANT